MMKFFVPICLGLMLLTWPAFASEGGTGLMPPTPEPGTFSLGLTGAALLGGYMIWRAKRRFKQIDAEDQAGEDGDHQ